jgi:acetaldehyde dehydrogenase (acetylating)
MWLTHHSLNGFEKSLPEMFARLNDMTPWRILRIPPFNNAQMDSDLLSIQQARSLLKTCSQAQKVYREFSQKSVDGVVSEMISAGTAEAERLAVLAHEETGFGRVESKIQKNLFATRTLGERMKGMRTCGVIRKREQDTVWEIATPMGVIAALVPSTNPTSTAMYKAIIAAKSRCGVVISPHPRAAESTAEALRIVAEAAYRAGAPEGLFACMTEISLQGTDALLEDERTDLILATGGSAMVRAAYSKGKPAYGVGSGNVPVYVDRSADLEKAAGDIIYGAYFDHGTLCSTERSIVADLPIKNELLEQLRRAGGYLLDDTQKGQLRDFVWTDGHLNVDQVGKSPTEIAKQAGFSVPPRTKALIAEVNTVGPEEPLSAETLSPILSFFTADGWEAGCERCKSILDFGGIGHTLGLHCGSDRVIEAFAMEKPAMRIVVNTVCALGSVGFTTRLFPAMTLGPGTMGGSITSDNISPLHLVNIKRLAFETDPINAARQDARRDQRPVKAVPARDTTRPWMDVIDERLRKRAGNPPSGRPENGPRTGSPPTDRKESASENGVDTAPSDPATSENVSSKSEKSLSEDRIEDLIRQFRR